MAEKTITMIPARKRVGSQDKTQEEKPKLRVAAYCRVSTDSEEQESSYEMQVAHYTEYIEGHKDWVLAGIYADDGISGTNTKKREEFNRMIADCMDAKIDMVITKSISRFARNTLDCLKYIRQLKEKNISVFFEKENINTMDAKEYESCAARTVNEEWLHDIVIRAVNKLLDSSENFLPQLKENIEKGLHSEEQEEVGRIDAKLLLLQEELIRKANARQDYEGTAEEIERLRAEKDKLLLIAAGKENDRQRLIEIAEFLERTPGKITEYDDLLVRRLIEKITVFDHYFLVEFKTGAEFKIIG